MALSLDDVMSAPTDPNLLRQHLYNLGVLSPGVTQPAEAIPPMTPPIVPPPGGSPALVPTSFRPPTNTEAKGSTERPSLPAMKSSELPEAPTMTAPAVAPTGGVTIPPMRPPVPLAGDLSPGVTQPTQPAVPETLGGVPFYEQNLARELTRQPDSLQDHPSFLGKVGHVLARVGNIAGDIVAPGTMALIPGTDLNKRFELARAERNLETAKEHQSEEGLRRAQEQHLEAETAKMGAPGQWQPIEDKAGDLVGLTGPDGKQYDIDDPAVPPAWQKMAKNWQATGKAPSAMTGTPPEIAMRGLLTGGPNGGPQINPKTNKPYTELEALAEVGTGQKLPEGEMPLKNIDQMNAVMKKQYQVLHPGAELPSEYTLKEGATQKDYDRIDKALDTEEKSKASQAQLATANGFRAMAANLAAQGQAEREEQRELTWVTGETPDGKTVMVPLSQAKAMGLKNQAKADADHVNKTLSARVVVPMLYNNDPADPGVLQLIDQLQKNGDLGVVSSRWNDFMTRHVGDDTTKDHLYTQLRTKLDLAQTKMMQAHVGSRGGSYMLEHFEDLANAKKLDAPTLRAAVDAELRYMNTNAQNPGRGAASSGGPKVPKKGDVVGGYTFQGGDPNDQNNWTKAKK